MVDKYKVKVGDVLFDNKNKKYVTITEIDLTSYLCLGYKDTDMSYWMGAASTYDYKCKYKNIMQIDKNNWQIKVNEENREELVDYFILKYTGKDYMREIGRVNFGGEFLSIHDYQIPFLTHYQDSNIPLITTDQFRKYILGKEDRKIIGYKAPFDLFEEQVKSGDMYMKSGLFYHEENNKGFPLPKEIVEKYFYPVYEEEEKVIELHGYKIMKGKILDRLNVDMKDIISGMWEYYNGIIKAYEELNK